MTIPPQPTVRHPVLGYRHILWPASVWFGLGSGLLEVLILGVGAVRFGGVFPLNPQFVWMVPAVAIGLSAGLGLALFCTARLLPGKLITPAVVFSFSFLAFLGPLFSVPRLHYLAVLCLGVGLAVQTTRVILPRVDRWLALAPRGIGWMAAVVVCLGAGVNMTRSLHEDRVLATLPPAPAHGPNVLFIVLDTVRAESLSLYGYPKRTTPELERLASTAVVFNAAIATAPWTLPSHASMFTGRWPHELSTDWRSPLDGTYPTLAEILSARGYATAGFVANLIYGSFRSGLSRGFLHYDDFPVSAGEALVSSSLGTLISTDRHLRRLLNEHRVPGRKTAAEVNAEFLGWLPNGDRRPFFAFLNYMDAHEPYLPPPPFDTQFGPSRQKANFSYSPIDAFRPGKWAMSPAEARIESAQYDGAIAYMDHELGHLIDELKTRGVLENTLLIVVSDHGEHLGEHRLFGHGNSLYRDVIEVPLLIAFPGHVPAGASVNEPVTLRDIPETVMELVGAGVDTRLPGASLSRYWRRSGSDSEVGSVVLSEASQRVFGAQQPWYPLFKGNMRSLVAAGFHYIQNDNGDEELYDFAHDRAEERNLVGSDETRLILTRLRAALAESGAHAATGK